MNRLTESIRELCSRFVLEEKWLLVPSYRVGLQWLDVVAMSGQPVINLRLKTLSSLAMQLVAERMESEGLAFVSGPGLQMLCEELYCRCCGDGSYLPRAGSAPGLAGAAFRSLLDLRLAGLRADDLKARDFEVAEKGRELAALLRAYEEELARRRLVDYAGALALAEEELRRQPAALPENVVIAIPEDMERSLRGREKYLWLALPEGRRMRLPVDRPEDARDRESDASLLRFISRPKDAPPPVRDGTAELYRAVGECNEVREIFRRCLAGGIPFDEVEILHSDGDTYVPLIIEIASLLLDTAGDPPPVTFSEGLPVRFSRPGRALLGLLSWIRDDFPQATLASLIQEGLLRQDDGGDGAWSRTRLAALLLSLPIGKGRERYREVFASYKKSASCEEDTAEHEAEGDGDEHFGPFSRPQGMRLLEELCERLFSLIPTDPADAAGLLDGVAEFLDKMALCAGEMDEYARNRLRTLVADAAQALDGATLSASRVLAWLEEQAGSARVEGEGPRPGRAYVAPLHSGGHSGRPHVFIVGLDDGRFPGTGLQDPLLLDAERTKLSGELSTASQRTAARLDDLASLMARLRGRVTLSYSCRDLAEDREMFPSQAMVNAFRIIIGSREGTQEDLLSFLSPPVSFAPREENCCATTSEWWLYRLCGQGAVRGAEEAVAAAFPHLARGLQARRARESDAFTVYDGYVPEAGEDLDPTAPDGPVLSTRRLEMLGRCPLDYFFAYVLEIKPPDEFTYDPFSWLDVLERGELLHRVFRIFYQQLGDAGSRVSFRDHWPLLRKIVDGEISRFTSRKPPPSPEVLAAEREELLRAAAIFLREEESCSGDRTPLYCEVAVGLAREGAGNPVDLPEPLEIALPGGEKVRVRGYIDRIDALGDAEGGRFLVCDYKTGSARKYTIEDPFVQGRHMQGFIYKALAEACLATRHPRPEVAAFEYFFPDTREYGKRISWDARRLEEGLDVLDGLCRLLRAGCFPCSDSDDDLKYSDYLVAIGEVEKCTERAKRKLANPENALLEPLRCLRKSKEK